MAYRLIKGDSASFRSWAVKEKLRIQFESVQIVNEVLAEAVVEQKRILDTATTPWGRFRQSQGRASAGRRESDTMYDAISSDLTVGRAEVVGEWGWLGLFLKYFEYQDNGTGRIEAANSLAQSFVKAQQSLAAKVKSRMR
jgi:hypothetical protein